MNTIKEPLILGQTPSLPTEPYAPEGESIARGDVAHWVAYQRARTGAPDVPPETLATFDAWAKSGRPPRKGPARTVEMAAARTELPRLFGNGGFGRLVASVQKAGKGWGWEPVATDQAQRLVGGLCTLLLRTDRQVDVLTNVGAHAFEGNSLHTVNGRVDLTNLAAGWVQGQQFDDLAIARATQIEVDRVAAPIDGASRVLLVSDFSDTLDLGMKDNHWGVEARVRRIKAMGIGAMGIYSSLPRMAGSVLEEVFGGSPSDAGVLDKEHIARSFGLWVQNVARDSGTKHLVVMEDDRLDQECVRDALLAGGDLEPLERVTIINMKDPVPRFLAGTDPRLREPLELVVFERVLRHVLTSEDASMPGVTSFLLNGAGDSVESRDGSDRFGEQIR